MGIRTEKKKVLQQIVNNEDSSLPLDPEPLLEPADLHWFQALKPKKENPETPLPDADAISNKNIPS
jgi:hypothetical protein